MTSLTEMINDFENCITSSVIDSIVAIERKFTLSQTRYGNSEAMKALATAYIIAESRRRFLEAELEKIRNA